MPVIVIFSYKIIIIIFQARKELAEQLAISRDLTKKVQIEESSDDDSEEQINEKCAKANADNPWVSDQNVSEVDKFVDSYREFWKKSNFQNKSDETDVEKQKSISKTDNTNDSESSVSSEKIYIETQNSLNYMQTINSNNIGKRIKKGKKAAAKQKKLKKEALKDDYTHIVGTTDSWEVTKLSSEMELRPNCKTDNKKSVVELDDMFTTMEENMKSLAKKKLQQHKNAVNKLKEKNSPELSNNKTYISLEFKQSHNIPIIDEPLLENANGTTLNTVNREKCLININDISTERASKVVDDIDPSKFISVKSKSLKSGLPNLADADEAIDDEDDAEAKQLTISEAFADDDVVEEFR